MTNDDLKRFYPVNSNQDKPEGFVRYDKDGNIPGSGSGGTKKYMHEIYLTYIDQRLYGRLICERSEAFTSIADLANYLITQGNPVVPVYSSTMYYLGNDQDVAIGFTAGNSTTVNIIEYRLTTAQKNINIEGSSISVLTAITPSLKTRNAHTISDNVTQI